MSSASPKKADAVPLLDLTYCGSYLRRIGARERSQRVWVVEDTAGKYPRTIATIRFQKETKGKPDKDGEWTVYATPGFEPTEVELAAIKVELPTVKWLEWSMAYGFNKADLPAPYGDLDDKDLFICRSPERDASLKRPTNDRRGPEVEHPIIMI